jgi:photosystem II stability/assembly factor-like uncharacterized protein
VVLVLAGVPAVAAQASGTQAHLQAVAVVSDRVAWVSGRQGTYARTTDGGVTWTAAVVPGAESLEFRDVQATDERRAVLLSSGPGDRSRVYRTTDGGQSWSLALTNPDPEGFWDCFAFWDAERGLLWGDAVSGRHPAFVTADGGARWERLADDVLPPALPGEAGFAASGTCVTVFGASAAWIGTGQALSPRVLRTSDAGRSWSAAPAPLAAGPMAGITSLAFRDPERGIAGGGRISSPDTAGTIAVTSDGGRHWTSGGTVPFEGAVYVVAWLPGRPDSVVAAGPKGLALSADAGKTWGLVDAGDWWSIGFASSGVGWAVGPAGRIARLELR